MKPGHCMKHNDGDEQNKEIHHTIQQKIDSQSIKSLCVGGQIACVLYDGEQMVAHKAQTQTQMVMVMVVVMMIYRKTK